MENERPLKINCFGSAVFRLFTWKYFLIQFLIMISVAIFSPVLLRDFCRVLDEMPKDFTETFRMGNVYNIGILTVPTLDFSKIDVMDILTGLFSSIGFQIMIVLLVCTFIIKEYKCGYIHRAIMKGCGRVKLFFKYVFLLFLVMLLVISVYLICLGFSAGITKGYEPSDIHVGKMFLQVYNQIVMIISVVVIAAIVTLLIPDFKAIIIVESSIVIMPYVPVYLDSFLGKQLNIGKYILFYRLVQSGHNADLTIVGDILVAVLTSVIIYIVGVMIFRRIVFD